jgi:hypothetical protein
VQLRLYATDAGDAPRWDGEWGRSIERAATENGAVEGDRYLVVRIGNRYVEPETLRELAEAIEGLLDDFAKPEE